MTADQELGSVAARGAATMLVAQVARVGIQMLSIVVLARLLTPADYGLVAMSMVIISFADIFRDFGFSAAAVQARTLSDGQRANLFWANTSIGIALSVAVAMCGPLVAAMFHEPRLQDLVAFMGVTFALNGAATQYRASLTRSMRFGAVAWTDVLGQGAGLAVGVVLALAGWSYWALAMMQIAGATVVLLAMVLLAGWLPGLPRRGEDMGDLLKFGTFLVGSQLVTYASNNIDSLVLGRRFGAETVGIYDRPYRLLMLPLAQIRAPSTSVALPVLARLQDDDRRFGAFLLRGQVALGYALVVPLGFVAGAAAPVVAVFLGAQWTSSAPILALLAVAGGLRTLAFVGYWVYLSRGLTGSLMAFSTVSALVKIVLVVVGATWGVLGVAGAVALSPAIMWGVSIWWLSTITVIPRRGLLIGGMRIAIVASFVAAIAWVTVWATGDVVAPWVQLLVAAAAAGLGLGLLMLALPAVRRDVVSLGPAARAIVHRRRR